MNIKDAEAILRKIASSMRDLIIEIDGKAEKLFMDSQLVSSHGDRAYAEICNRYDNNLEKIHFEGMHLLRMSYNAQNDSPWTFIYAIGGGSEYMEHSKTPKQLIDSIKDGFLNAFPLECGLPEQLDLLLMMDR